MTGMTDRRCGFCRELLVLVPERSPREYCSIACKQGAWRRRQDCGRIKLPVEISGGIIDMVDVAGSFPPGADVHDRGVIGRAVHDFLAELSVSSDFLKWLREKQLRARGRQ